MPRGIAVPLALTVPQMIGMPLALTVPRMIGMLLVRRPAMRQWTPPLARTLPLNVRGGSRRSRLVAVPVKVSTLRRTFCHRARIIYRVG